MRVYPPESKNNPHQSFVLVLVLVFCTPHPSMKHEIFFLLLLLLHFSLSTFAFTVKTISASSRFTDWVQLSQDQLKTNIPVRISSFNKPQQDYRGLSIPKSTLLPLPPTPLISISPKLTICSDNFPSSPTLAWDTKLAAALISQVRRGSPYTSLLLSSKNPVLHSPRNWEPEELIHLPESFLKAIKQQSIEWKTKYGDFVATANNNELKMTHEEFVWAMEVVHSRAFRDITSSKNANAPFTLLAQFACLGVGFYR